MSITIKLPDPLNVTSTGGQILIDVELNEAVTKATSTQVQEIKLPTLTDPYLVSVSNTVWVPTLDYTVVEGTMTLSRAMDPLQVMSLVSLTTGALLWSLAPTVK